MKLKIFVLAVSLLLLSVGAGKAWPEEVFVDRTQSIMHPDTETSLKWIQEYENAPKAFIDPVIADELARAKALNVSTSLSLLGYVGTVGVQREQGYCGNCWVWAGTGAMEIGLNRNHNSDMQLSIQYLDSCMTTLPDNQPFFACSGGTQTEFTDWYFHNGGMMMIPWTNANAYFADGSVTSTQTASSVSCSSISTVPHYQLILPRQFGLAWKPYLIPTTGGSQATAISNIINLLNQGYGVVYSFFLPEWSAFVDFWRNQDESALWTPDQYCWMNYYPSIGGAHAVLIVGYNDDDPANSYWIVLNSWGTTASRPNGLFRLSMNMNYDCRLIFVTDKDGLRYFQSEYAQFFEVTDAAPYFLAYSISGTVKNSSGVPLSGVLMRLDGAGTLTLFHHTDSTGSYTFTGLPSGTYTVTPILPGYTFTPASLEVTVNNANLTGQNFTATYVPPPTYTISGTVTSDGVALSGVTMTANIGVGAETATTDSNGNYTFTGVPNGSWTVVPSKTGYKFTPSDLVVTVLNANMTGQNFFAFVSRTYSISGTVKTSYGVAVSGLRMMLKDVNLNTTIAVITNTMGFYEFTGVPNGSYTITPHTVLQKYTFQPRSISVTISGANKTGENFIEYSL